MKNTNTEKLTELFESISDRFASLFLLTFLVFFLPFGNMVSANSNAGNDLNIFPQIAHNSFVVSVAYSPDGRTLVSGSSDNTLKMWDAASGELLRTLSGHEGRVWSVAYSPDGRTLVSGSDDNTLKMWDAASGELLRTLSGHEGRVLSVAYSPDGRTLVSGSSDNTLKQWEITGELITTTILLPGNQWLSWSPTHPGYVSSQQGDEFFGLRFGKVLRPVYPLEYYRDPLKMDSLAQPFTFTRDFIEPKLWQLRWDRFQYKQQTASFLLLFLAFGMSVYYLRRERSDPMSLARRFFKDTAWSDVEKLSGTLLKLSDGSHIAYVWRWSEIDNNRAVLSDIRPRKPVKDHHHRLYIVYDRKPPAAQELYQLRHETRLQIVPLATLSLEKAVASGDSKRVLLESEERYLSRTDPYMESNPIRDPGLFFGRQGMLKSLPPQLLQGQHVCLLGLRKVGKTSLMNQVVQRLGKHPVVVIDCQAYSAVAAHFFTAILEALKKSLEELQIRTPTITVENLDATSFVKGFCELYASWTGAGNSGRAIIVFDEVDKLFPIHAVTHSESTLREYVTLFKALRGMAQAYGNLSLLVATYRSDVNSCNKISFSVGENPMFRAYSEVHLGFLDQADSTELVRELGQWQGIDWADEAAERIYYYCGGHPLLTRYFASIACDEGQLKLVTLDKVEKTANEVMRSFRKNDIGNYYKESIWQLLTEPEKTALHAVYEAQPKGFKESAICADNEQPIGDLEKFGLIIMRDDRLHLTALLFERWLSRRFQSVT